MPVCARATISAIVVASEPFLQNIAQSAWLTIDDQRLGKIDDQRRRAGHRIATGHLLDIGAVDLGIAVAEQLRTVGAHQVKQQVAVRVPQPRAFRAREVLRVAVRQGGDGLVSIHAAGNDAGRAFSQCTVSRLRHSGLSSTRGCMIYSVAAGDCPAQKRFIQTPDPT